jgi:phosphoribosylanthranilate isomerase
MVKVKICGITNSEDALKAAFYGAWAVGFVFYKKSPRYVSPSKVKKIISELPPFVTPVGVFVDQNDRALRDICGFTGIRTLQFHGREEPGLCHRFREYSVIKAFRIKDEFNFDQLNRYKVQGYLFDAFQDDALGGTGKQFDWDLLKGKTFQKPFILSGGLNASNIRQAVEAVNPYAVDVSSGVEKSPGIKDHRLIRDFFATIYA